MKAIHSMGYFNVLYGFNLYVGGETGGTMSFDGDWNYRGATVRQEFYVGYGPARAYAGHEWGFSGAAGRGWYGGARAFGANVEYAQNGGLSGGVSGGMVSYSYSSGDVIRSNYIGRGLISQAFDESNMPLPPIRENMTDDYLKKTTGWFYTNYTGPKETSANELTYALDAAAYYHDKAYEKAGAAGYEGAFISTKPMVVAADWKFAGRAFVAMVNPNATSFNSLYTFWTNSWNRFGSLLAGIGFTGIATYKTLGMADYRYHKYQY